jgi:hypothetical protein
LGVFQDDIARFSRAIRYLAAPAIGW